MRKPAPRAPSPLSNAPEAPLRRFNHKANNELLFKGVLCTLIGLGVLISPSFMAATEMRGVIAGASTVGWFALVLGGAFAAKALVRRWKATRT